MADANAAKAPPKRRSKSIGIMTESPMATQPKTAAQRERLLASSKRSSLHSVGMRSEKISAAMAMGNGQKPAKQVVAMDTTESTK